MVEWGGVGGDLVRTPGMSRGAAMMPTMAHATLVNHRDIQSAASGSNFMSTPPN